MSHDSLQTHLVSTVPAYDGPEVAQSRVEVSFCIRSGGKYSDSHVFSYVQNLNCSEGELRAWSSKIARATCAPRGLMVHLTNARQSNSLEWVMEVMAMSACE